MINAIVDKQLGFNLQMTCNGMLVYLDNCAIITLAKDTTGLRDLFLEVFSTGCELLFSETNAVEITGPSYEREIEQIRAFLDAIGPRWLLATLDPGEVMAREEDGLRPPDSYIAPELLKALVGEDWNRQQAERGIISLDASTFRLSAFLDVLGPQREFLQTRKGEMDQHLMAAVAQHRKELKGGRIPAPDPVFHTSAPCSFAYKALLRQLVMDRSRQVKAGDGMDLFHASLAAAFASVAVLDKGWAARVNDLPKPHALAPCLGVNQLPRFVEQLKQNVQRLHVENSRAPRPPG